MKYLLLLAVPAVGLAVWAAGAGASRSAQTAGTVHVVERAITDVVSNGKKTDSLGNLLTFANPVYDAANAKRIGSDSGFCVRTVKGKRWECEFTTTLGSGQISVQGPFSDTGNTKLAITGGTGEYADSRGWMELKYHNAKGTAFDFIFHLT